MVKWFLFAILALLTGEVAAFLAVGALIGLPQALILLVTTSFLGVLVLRHPGRSRISRLHDAVAKNGLSGLEAGGDAFLTVAAGFLLILPGFLTDAAGLLLLVPRVRAWVAGRFQGFVHRQRSGSPDVVDLDRNQWDRVADRQIDDRRRPNSPP